jgi:hypothetical protein
MGKLLGTRRQLGGKAKSLFGEAIGEEALTSPGLWRMEVRSQSNLSKKHHKNNDVSVW